MVNMSEQVVKISQVTLCEVLENYPVYVESEEVE